MHFAVFQKNVREKISTDKITKIKKLKRILERQIQKNRILSENYFTVKWKTLCSLYVTIYFYIPNLRSCLSVVYLLLNSSHFPALDFPMQCTRWNDKTKGNRRFISSESVARERTRRSRFLLLRGRTNEFIVTRNWMVNCGTHTHTHTHTHGLKRTVH